MVAAFCSTAPWSNVVCFRTFATSSCSSMQCREDIFLVFWFWSVFLSLTTLKTRHVAYGMLMRVDLACFLSLGSFVSCRLPGSVRDNKQFQRTNYHSLCHECCWKCYSIHAYFFSSERFCGYNPMQNCTEGTFFSRSPKRWSFSMDG